MAKGKPPAPAKKPKKPDIRTFFKPNDSPSPRAAVKSRVPDQKGKRKAVTIELDSDSDSDIEIVEPLSKPTKKVRVKKAHGEERGAVAGPTMVKVEEGAGKGIKRRVGSNEEVAGLLAGSAMRGWRDGEDDAAIEARDREGMEVDEVGGGGGEGLLELAGQEGRVADPNEKPVEAIGDLEGNADGMEVGSDWGDDEGEKDPDYVGEVVKGDWGEEKDYDASEGGEGDGDANWAAADAFDGTPDPPPDDGIEVEVDIDIDPKVVEGSSKDLQPPSSTPPTCPVCEKLLKSLPEDQHQLHVNKCLDGPRPGFFTTLFRSTFPSSTKASPPTHRKPLTSLPVPSAKPTPSNFAGPPLPNAFAALMAGHAESKQWKEAEKIDGTKGRLPKCTKRVVPFYKWVDGLEVTVDAFKYGKIEGCKAYFLSHAHSDHCSQTQVPTTTHLRAIADRRPAHSTANLIKLKLKVKDEWLHPLPFNQTTLVHGISVTLIDANHCPGSALFLFEGPHTCPKSSYSKTPSRIFRYLHCGDFRASPEHITHPALVNKNIDACFLDTTYLDPKYCFPAQQLVIDACAELVRARVVEGDEAALFRAGGGPEQVKQEKMMKGWFERPEKGKEVEGEGVEGGVVKAKKVERLLVLVGTYSIGKERIVKGIAEALETKIYCDDAKLKLLKAQDDPELHDLITRDPFAAQVHIGALGNINQAFLFGYLAQYGKGPRPFTKIIGLKPTGWTYRPESKGEAIPKIAKVLEQERQRTYSPAGMYPQGGSKPSCLCFGVPYSEHSSFYELTCFALSLNCLKFIPTVNIGSEESRRKMSFWFARWADEKRKRATAKLPPLVPPRGTAYW